MDNKTLTFALHKKLFFISFFIANLFLSSYYIDIWCTPNAVSRALPVLTWHEEGTIRIDKYQNKSGDKSKVGDHYYSDKAPLPTFAAIPFYWLMDKAGWTKTTEMTCKKYPVYIWSPVGISDGRETMFSRLIPLLFMGSLLFGSLPFAFIIFLALRNMKETKGNISPVLLVMLTFYGSFMFVYAGTYFNHVFAGFLVLLSYIMIKSRNFFWSGMFIGLSFLSEYPIAAIIPFWIIAIWLREKSVKKILFYCLGLIPAFIIIALYNYSITGHPHKMLVAYHAVQIFKDLHQNYGFGFPTAASLWGLSFSSYMGLLPHIPVLLLCLYFLIKDWFTRFSFKSFFYNYLFMFSVPFFLVISSFFTWWGGWSYGPRYLVSLGIILAYEGVLYLSKIKVNQLLFILIAGFGLISSWLAKITVMYMIPDNTSELGPSPGDSAFQQFILPEFTKGHFNSNNILTLGLDVPADMAAYLWFILFIGLTALLMLWYTKIYSPVKLVTPVQPVKPKKRTGKR
jgi:hypothetical protein